MASMLSPRVWISSDRRRLVQVVPDPIREWYDKWDLRIAVLIAFFCHYFLLHGGGSRRTDTDTYRIIWPLYMTLEWVLSLSLGIISSKVGEQVGENDNNQALVAFWSTILLVQIGGPPTITAEALEDNALWHRTFLLWIFQTIRVLYIVLLAWRSNSWLSYFSSGMLLVGFIKCGEKTWAQYNASINIDEKSIISNRNSNELEMDDFPMDPPKLFEHFKLFFFSLSKDFVLSSKDLEREKSRFRNLGSKKAFEFVELQLWYAFNVFYTKVYVMFTHTGKTLCAITVSITMAVFICFCVVRDTAMHRISKVDRVITWILVVEVIFQELCTVAMLVGSSWNIKLMGPVDGPFYDEWRAFMNCNLITFSLQHNLHSWSLEHIKFELSIDDKTPDKSSKVNEVLTKNIFDYLLAKSNSTSQQCIGKNGMNFVIEESGLKSIEWTKHVEFHQSILTWHVATDLCFYHGIDDVEGLEQTVKDKVDNSKKISGYMLYLVVGKRYMLPIGRGVITIPATFIETSELFRELKAESNNVRDACEKLLRFYDEERGKRVQFSDSAVFDACRLARSLINEMETVKRWEFLEAMWIEILGYAATQCSPVEHAQQLRKGGEFLSRIWLLMAHLGLMEQFHALSSSQDQSTHHINGQEQGNNDERLQIPDEDRTGEGEVEVNNIVEEIP
ncbi:hypothetical protein PIB30_007637 [Stylosanthes scabra]|uniref:DUF4220 domain-containing protein n=1 Tax=Stylosanthes scabra TaxID=79078 RepID=A0ABU6V6H8_9FABA|nr:hypothetical protein [Stylosanthes scabra]